MLISFMDLLGFNNLVKKCPLFAYQNFERFNEIWKTMYTDAKTFAGDSSEFIQGKLFASPNNFISISDSVFITSEDNNVEQFIYQICEFIRKCFVANDTPYYVADGLNPSCNYCNDIAVNCAQKEDQMACSYPFSESICASIASPNKESEERYKAFRMRNSILFRGGLHLGKHISIWESPSVVSDKAKGSLNIFGYDYVKAVSLEASDKGVRLFCDNTVLDALSSDSRVRKASRLISSEKGVFEILWPYIATHFSDARGYNESNTYDKVGFELGVLRPHVSNAVSMLEYATELMKIYHNSPAEIRIQYEKTLEVVALGIYKYAVDNGIHKLLVAQCSEPKDIGELINYKIATYTDYRISNNSLRDFPVPYT